MNTDPDVEPSGTTSQVLPLSVFQRVMLQWSEVHPYNACHLYQIAGRLDEACFRRAAREGLAACGWGTACIQEDRRSWRLSADDDVDVRTVRVERDIQRQLETEITLELNRPFERPRCRPIRFVLFDAPAENSHWIAAAYDHWTADSVSMRLLMRSVLSAYLKMDGSAGSVAPQPCALEVANALQQPLRGLEKCRIAAATVARSFFQRQPIQPAAVGRRQSETAFRWVRFSDGLPTGLHAFARQYGGTVHDALSAMLHQTLARHLPRRRAWNRCNSIALGSIVDIRGELSERWRESLGVVLGFWTVREPAREFASLGDAVAAFARHSRRCKANRLAVQSLVRLELGAAVWPLLPRGWRAELMRRAMPLTAGITNVAVRDPWMERDATAIECFARAAPLGPILPLVISPTTCGERFNMGVTYAVNEFTESKINEIIDDFSEQIVRVAEDGRRSSSPQAA